MNRTYVRLEKALTLSNMASFTASLSTLCLQAQQEAVAKEPAKTDVRISDGRFPDVLTVTLNHSLDSCDIFQNVDILSVVSKELPVILQFFHETMTQRRLILARKDFLK